jgi:uncharacterized membrane protein
MIDFFSPEEEKMIIRSIKDAEDLTSGEIRVHLASSCPSDPVQEAQQVFIRLKMQATRERNGMLIWIAPHQKKLAIIGDKGIHEKVGGEFWEMEKDLLLHHFKNGTYAEGLCIVIKELGLKLKTFFPANGKNDNELTDEISFEN